MSERGYICLSRGALDHEFFRRSEFSEFEAWVWLLTEAAWKPRSRRVGEFLVQLDRGQLVASIRHLAEVWSWSKGKVERFVNRLKTETMVGTHTETGITIITICNYDKYQKQQESSGTATKQEPGQPRDTHGDNTEEIKTLKKETVGGASAPNAEGKSRKRPSRPMPDIFPASDAMRAYAEKRGYKFEIPPCFAFNKARPGPAQAMFEAFKNHHGAKGSQFADWDAAWRTWVDNQAKWDTERGKPPGLRPAI
jgi:hypothetical protein